MKLYYTPGACSLSPHIALQEGGFTFQIEKVDLREKKTETGANFLDINPKGQVPALVLDNGQLLTEGPAVVQYLADLVPAKKLAPAAGTLERVRLQEWLNFVSTEIHKLFGPLFMPNTTPEAKAASVARLTERYNYVNKYMEGRNYLLADDFSVVDGYLFTTLSWCGYVGIDVGQWPALKAYQGRVAMRPAVQAALKAEGLMK